MDRSTRKLLVGVGSHIFRLRVPSDHPQALSGDAGSATDRHTLGGEFGRLWPAARVMAEVMTDFSVAGLRILEVHCGVALPSLVLKRRGADITASDHHALAEDFLEYNAALNELGRIAYVDTCGFGPMQDIGHFDLIIACHVLDERDLAEVVRLVMDHAAWNVEIMISEPMEGLAAPFIRKMQRIGFSFSAFRPRRYIGDFRFEARLLRFKRPVEFLNDPAKRWAISSAAPD